MGVAGLATLGKRWGESLRNGHERRRLHHYDNPGPTGQPVTSNRFKDFGLRVSLTPFGHDSIRSSYLRNSQSRRGATSATTAALSSPAARGRSGPGTNGAITSGMTRNRFGCSWQRSRIRSICDFRNGGRCRLSAGLEYAQRRDASDNGGNTIASPRVVHDSTGRALRRVHRSSVRSKCSTRRTSRPSASSRGSIISRRKRIPASSVPGAANYAGSNAGVQLLDLGASYDVNQRITLTANWQNQTPDRFPAAHGSNVRPTPNRHLLHSVGRELLREAPL